MGVVWRAIDTRLRRDVALKVLTAAPDGAALEPFLKEARASARLRHPGIVVVYGAEVVEGRAVVALELVEGGSLAAKLKEGKEPVAPREAARLVADLSDAVQAAHAEGVIHRDLKPSTGPAARASPTSAWPATSGPR
jgi:serine/threonine protein kinase